MARPDGLDATGLTDANAPEFRQDRRSRGLARFRGTQGLALLLSFLRGAGAAPPPAAAEPGDEAGVLVAEFAAPGRRARPEAADRRPLLRCRTAVPGLAARGRRGCPGRRRRTLSGRS